MCLEFKREEERTASECNIREGFMQIQLSSSELEFYYKLLKGAYKDKDGKLAFNE